MTPPRRTQQELDQIPDGPVIEEQDWEAMEGADIEPVSVPDNGDLRYDPQEDEKSGQLPGDLPGEDDDNAYGESDEALPDDEDESSISRNPSKEGGLFDEI